MSLITMMLQRRQGQFTRTRTRTATTTTTTTTCPSISNSSKRLSCSEHRHPLSWNYSSWRFSVVAVLQVVFLLITTSRGISASDGFVQLCPLGNIPISTVSMDSTLGIFYFTGRTTSTTTTTSHANASHARSLAETTTTTKHDSFSQNYDYSLVAAETLQQQPQRRKLRQPQQQQPQESAGAFPGPPQHQNNNDPNTSVSGNNTTPSGNNATNNIDTTSHSSSSIHSNVSGTGSSTNNNSKSSEEFHVRECGCFAQTRALTHRFCPSLFDTCGILYDALYDDDIPVICFASQTLSKEILRTAWPILLVWVSLLMAIACVTDVSMDARHFYLRVLCCRKATSYNEVLVDRILAAQPGSMTRLRRRRQAFLHSYLAEAGLNQTIIPVAPSVAPPQPQPLPPPNSIPTALELRTKRYKADRREGGGGGDHNELEDDDDDDGHEASCSICFHTINDGDRIGALTCLHNFHVDCLKSWLSRRNTCPLCQASNVATTRYEQQVSPHNDHESDPAAGASAAGAGAGAQQPPTVVLTQVSPFVNPFSSGLIRQQVMMTVQARQNAARINEARNTDGFRGRTILPPR